ncbi:MAG: hypothetical protein ACPLRM_06845, partial [Anaerolineae bacterium]
RNPKTATTKKSRAVAQTMVLGFLILLTPGAYASGPMRVSLNQTTTRPVLLSFTQAALLGTFQRLFYEGHHDTRVASRLAKETPPKHRLRTDGPTDA